MLAEIPAEEVELRRDVQHALEELDEPAPVYEPIPFDVFAEYPRPELPAFEVLSESERMQLIESPDAETRAAAAHSFFNQELHPKTRATLLQLAQSDPDAKVRGRAWESLADATEDAAIRDAMLAVLTDTSRDVVERGGRSGRVLRGRRPGRCEKRSQALYDEDGKARVKALESMWRSLWGPFAKFFPNIWTTPTRRSFAKRCAERATFNSPATPTRSRATSIGMSVSTTCAKMPCSRMRSRCPAKPREAGCAACCARWTKSRNSFERDGSRDVRARRASAARGSEACVRARAMRRREEEPPRRLLPESRAQRSLPVWQR